MIYNTEMLEYLSKSSSSVSYAFLERLWTVEYSDYLFILYSVKIRFHMVGITSISVQK